jgi:UDP-glucose 4-epimerase
LARAHVDEVNYPAPAAAISPAMSIMPAAISVLEVIDVVKQVSGVGFPVRRSGRRPGGNRCRQNRIRAELGWKPQHDNLNEIVRQALDWERRLHNRTP